ncbi:unnamed protein product [Alopecurus aequalis]
MLVDFAAAGDSFISMSQIAGTCSSRSTSMMAWRRPMSPTLSSSPRGWWRHQEAWIIGYMPLTSRLDSSFPGRVRLASLAQPISHHSRTRSHKLDMDNDLDDVGSTSAETPLLLPEPPFARSPSACSHIFGISGRRRAGDGPRETLVFDTKARTLHVSLAFPVGLAFGYEAAINVRDRVYMFESYTDESFTDDDNPYSFHGGLHCLAAGPCADEIHWDWLPLSYSSPQFVWSCSAHAPDFPFDPKTIIGHVVHPKTDAIFVSANGNMSRGTFCYNIGGGGFWQSLGDWLLPFKGHGHYDQALDAWVGLHLNADGHLCACSVMPSPWQQPNWKVSRETLFLEHPYWSHVDAKLVYMGERSRYCLQERLVPKGADELMGAHMMKYVLRLTTFIVKYDDDGDLRIMVHQPARFYKAPSYSYRGAMNAFWI